MSGELTVCVLGFGDQTTDLGRCLESIRRVLPGDESVARVRIGLNRPSSALSVLPARWAASCADARPMLPCNIVRTTWLPKYPTARLLIHGDADADADVTPIETEYVMWFDDDSYICDDAPATFFADHVAAMAQGGYDLAGSRYTQTLRRGQRAWIEAQPWANLAVFPSPQKNAAGDDMATFCQGAWWIARTARLREWDYPWPQLYHNGGDVMLGELARRQHWKIRNTRDGVAINAGATGRESKAPRRGLDTDPIGMEGAPDGRDIAQG